MHVGAQRGPDSCINPLTPSSGQRLLYARCVRAGRVGVANVQVGDDGFVTSQHALHDDYRPNAALQS